MSRREVARRLAALLRPMAGLMTLSVLCRLVNQGLGVAIPALAAAGVAGVTAEGEVAGLVLFLVVLAVVKASFRYLEQFTGHAVAFRLLSRLRVDTYRRLSPLAPSGLQDERSGDLVARVIGDVDRVEPFFAHTIAPLAGAVAVPVLAAVGLGIAVDPMLAVVFLPFPLIIALVVPWVRAAPVARLASAAREEEGRTGALLTEAVQGRRELSVFRAAGSVADRLRTGSSTLGELRRRLARIASTRALLSDVLAAGTVVAVSVVAVGRLDEGAIDLPGLAAALAVAWVGTGPARALGEVVPDLEQALAAAGRLFRLDDRPLPVPPGGARPPLAPPLRFDQVTVGLGGRTVLDEVTAQVEEGSYTAIVGPTGSGKSTLLELAVRFRDPDSGRVEMGGVDLRTVDPVALREVVTLVPQRADLFHGTMRRNLSLGRPGAGEEQLRRSLEMVGLDAWVTALPHGLDTTIGELGETLSGGQRQRLALARGMLRDTPILLLDEATSELDAEAESVVLESLRRIRGRQTILMVAHRIDTVVDADLILVIDRGRLVEAGTHRDLIGSDGVYAGLWRRHQDVLA